MRPTLLSLLVQTPSLWLPLCWWWTMKGNMRGTGNQSPTELSWIEYCVQRWVHDGTSFSFVMNWFNAPFLRNLPFCQHVFAFNLLATCPPPILSSSTDTWVDTWVDTWADNCCNTLKKSVPSHFAWQGGAGCCVLGCIPVSVSIHNRMCSFRTTVYRVV